LGSQVRLYYVLQFCLFPNQACTIRFYHAARPPYVVMHLAKNSTLTCIALAAFSPRPIRWVPATSLPVAAQRSISNPFKPKDKPDEDLSNPLLEQYLKKREIEEGVAAAGKDKRPARPELRTGAMNEDPDSLFVPEREIPGWDPALPPKEQAALKARYDARQAAAKAESDKKLLDMNLDPDPPSRRKVERNLVIKSLKRHGRLTKAQNIARTERQSLFKSQDLPASTKKLQKVVNQIAGKTVSEALVQLRFSKKRVARDVIKGLELAQNEAILARGMGLGGGKRAQKRWEAQREQSEIPLSDKAATFAIEKQAAEKQGPVGSAVVELKDGSKKLVRDPSEIYIDQAWVGKGVMWKEPEFRARGKVNLLQHRSSSTSNPFVSGIPNANITQVSPSSSKKKRHACASLKKSRRSATTSNSGPRCPTGPSLHSASTVYGRCIIHEPSL
jgi:ribosomal protein L22